MSPSAAAGAEGRADLLVVGAAELLTAPATPGGAPLVGPALDRPILLRDASVACVEGRVAAVGPTPEVLAAFPEARAARMIDARGLLVAPGFVDAHTHLPFAGTREMEFDARARGESYASIAAKGGGIASSRRALLETKEEDLTALVAARLHTLLAQGVTTVEAKSGYGLVWAEERKQLRALAAAAPSSPVEIVPTFLAAHAVPEEFRERRDAYVAAVIEEAIPAVAREGLARFCDAWCDQGAFTVQESRRILEAGKRHGLRPKLHADELGDAGAARLAAEIGAVSADHLLFASEAGLDAMAAAGVVAVLLPGTAFTLGLPYAPARRMVERGAAVAVATDWNPGSTMSSSIALAMTMAVTQMKLTPAEAWMAATANAAAAIGAGDRIGRIQPGYRADMTLFDAGDHRHVAYHYGHDHVRLVVHSGRPVYERAEASSCF
ncbi:MAG TPA: imidazolonepropionase [Candidatus Eisenbacteria bacterium]|nr:imidazolonepropionase [Candidatus Eisenbacteria bacterium]